MRLILCLSKQHEAPISLGAGFWLIGDGLVLALVGDDALPHWGSIAVGAMGVFMGGFSIAAARRSFPGASRSAAIFSWLLAFFAAGFVLAPFVIAVVALGQLLPNLGPN